MALCAMVESSVDGICEVDADLLSQVLLSLGYWRDFYGGDVGTYIYVSRFIARRSFGNYCRAGSHGEEPKVRRCLKERFE
jgi:hypothetical protein